MTGGKFCHGSVAYWYLTEKNQAVRFRYRPGRAGDQDDLTTPVGDGGTRFGAEETAAGGVGTRRMRPGRRLLRSRDRTPVVRLSRPVEVKEPNGESASEDTRVSAPS